MMDLTAQLKADLYPLGRLIHVPAHTEHAEPVWANEYRLEPCCIQAHDIWRFPQAQERPNSDNSYSPGNSGLYWPSWRSSLLCCGSNTHTQIPGNAGEPNRKAWKCSALRA